MAKYFLDDIINSEFTKVTLYFIDGFMTQPERIDGYLVDDTVSLDATSNWSDISDNGYSEMLANFSELASKAVSMGTAYLGIGNKPVTATIQQWDGSERPQFDIGLLFIHAKNESNDRPENKVQYLNARCFPKFMGGVQAAPMYYQPVREFTDYFNQGEYEGNYESGGYSPVTGTVILKIGKWFLAPNLLLMNSSFEFSKECAPDGSPLYAQGKVQLTTARIISFKEYLNYFLLSDKSWTSSIVDLRG